MPEAIAEGTNVRGVISQLAHLHHKHFLIPQGKAEGLIFLRNRFIVHKFGLSWANMVILPEVQVSARGDSRGY